MAIDDHIRDEKLQYDINREAAKIPALLLGKTDKYEYLTGEEIWQFNQKRITERAKFTYSPLEKVLQKKKKKNWRSRRKTNKSNSKSRKN